MNRIVTRLTSGLQRARASLQRFRGDRRGIAAVEFALIAPLLLSLYFVSMEISLGLEGNKKVSRVSSMVADLVTQNSTVSKADLEAILKIGAAVVYPYNRTQPTIDIVGIEITDEVNPKAYVRWSRRTTNGVITNGVAKNTLITIPEKLKIRNTFLVMAGTSLDYRPVITWAADQKASLGLVGAFDRIPMRETYYFRPRMSAKVDCTDC